MKTITIAEVAESFLESLASDYPMVTMEHMLGHIETWRLGEVPDGFMERLVHDNLDRLKAHGYEVVA